MVNQKEPETALSRPREIANVAILTVVTVALVWALTAHVEALNGSRFHRWGWGHLAWSRVIPMMMLASLPFALACWLFQQGAKRWSWLSLLAIAMFMLQLVGVGLQMEPFDIGRISQIVTNAGSTGYFTDAEELRAGELSLRVWLANYPTLLPYFHLHSYNKPPGCILYWYAWLGLCSETGPAAFWGGILLAALAALAAPMTYLLAHLVTARRTAAFLAASWMTLTPSAVLIFPSMDQLFIVLGLAMTCSWLLALQKRHSGWAFACGAAVAGAMFFAYPLLVLGAFMLLAGLVLARREICGWFWLARQSAIVLGTVVAIYLIFWLATGFNTVATFQSAWRGQQAFEASFFMPRPFPQTLPSDFQDFFLGSGWISAIILLFWMIDIRRRWNAPTILILLGLLQPVIVGATGLYRCETARLWGFMQPLVLTAVGDELARWTPLLRAIAIGCIWAILVAEARNFIFLF